MREKCLSVLGDDNGIDVCVFVCVCVCMFSFLSCENITQGSSAADAGHWG